MKRKNGPPRAAPQTQNTDQANMEERAYAIMAERDHGNAIPITAITVGPHQHHTPTHLEIIIDKLNDLKLPEPESRIFRRRLTDLHRQFENEWYFNIINQLADEAPGFALLTPSTFEMLNLPRFSPPPAYQGA